MERNGRSAQVREEQEKERTENNGKVYTDSWRKERGGQERSRYTMIRAGE